MRHWLLFLLSLIITLSSCSESEDSSLFSRLTSSKTGISFSNEIKEDAQNNLINYLYFYNGAGIAAGDINNDGLIDLYFGSNQNINRLYLNKGNLEFSDITQSSNVGGEGDWTTGVTMADVNSDGWLDIYVCYVHGYNGFEGINELFINNQDGTFTESASDYGLGIRSYATHSTFFDYDNDGDLDMFLLNHSVHNKGTYGPSNARNQNDPDAGDRLFRNDDGRFEDVTMESGIFSSKLGYGLDVTSADINNDGYADLLISNDFHENDYFYINNGDGTFTDRLVNMTGHTSRFSMGNDVADINNDGLNDFAVLDMLPVDEKILKTSQGAESWDIYDLKIRYGYHHQVSRNTLQINQGNNLFSDVALMSGVYATDWSWSSLLVDLDMDGNRDLYITNGIFRRPNDSDYISYLSSQEVQKALQSGNSPENVNISSKMPSVKLSNYGFRKSPGSLIYADSTDSWGLNDPGYSNGAVYADLDNDGDPDLIVNNVNQEAFVYRNNSTSNYLKIRFSGPEGNKNGIGARCTVYTQNDFQLFENFNTRGFYSSIAPELIVGLGNSEKIDSVIVEWPGGNSQKIYDPPINQTLVINWTNSSPSENNSDVLNDPNWTNVDVGIDFQHTENAYVDFDVEPLMPHKLSTQGPALAKADLDKNGLDDIFIGGAFGQESALFMHFEGGFKKMELPGLINEVVDAMFFDADGDSDLDLYLAIGGNEVNRSDQYQDVLLINDGLSFTRSFDRLPSISNNSSSVAVHDFDNDGDVDIFLGSRSIPGQYGITPDSYLLINDGEGVFQRASKAVFRNDLGMVTDAKWEDFNNDGTKELLVAGEWMNISLFEFDGDRFIETTSEKNLDFTAGWWNCLEVQDVDNDGDQDIIAGNWGLNNIIKASKEEPAELFVNDFDGNGATEPIITFYKNGESYPIVSRDELVGQIAELKKKFVNYSDFSAVKIEDIFDRSTIESAEHKYVYTFESSIFLNDGNGGFKRVPLPEEAQVSPAFTIEMINITKNDSKDLILMGNFYGSRPYFGRYDASYGVFLNKVNEGTFEVETNPNNLMKISGEIRDTEIVDHLGKKWLIIAKNNADVEVVELK